MIFILFLYGEGSFHKCETNTTYRTSKAQKRRRLFVQSRKGYLAQSNEFTNVRTAGQEYHLSGKQTEALICEQVRCYEKVTESRSIVREQGDKCGHIEFSTVHTPD